MKLTFYLLLFLYPLILNAESPYIKEAEPAIIEVIYNRKQVTDTTSRDNRFFIDDVLLRIGNNKSLFCGVKKLWEDSVAKVDYTTYASLLKDSYAKDKNNFFFLGGRYWAYIYKNRQINRVIECDYFDMSHWKYEEQLQIPAWAITDSIKNCLGYDCIMATAKFKGREWIAWFTPEIPISDGPWKLCGLPGLILEAYDIHHDYEFTPKALYTIGIGPVGYMWYTPEDNYFNVSRDQFFKEWRKCKSQNMAAKIKATYNVKSSSSPKQKRVILYDREETDYPH